MDEPAAIQVHMSKDARALGFGLGSTNGRHIIDYVKRIKKERLTKLFLYPSTLKKITKSAETTRATTDNTMAI